MGNDLALESDEEILHEFRPTWAAWFWVLLFSIGLLAPWVWWRRRGLRYTVTDQRVIKHTGRVSSRTDEFRLSDVSRIQTEQSFGEKVLGGGSIVLDTGVDELTIEAVPNYSQVVSSIREEHTV